MRLIVKARDWVIISWIKTTRFFREHFWSTLIIFWPQYNEEFLNKQAIKLDPSLLAKIVIQKLQIEIERSNVERITQLLDLLNKINPCSQLNQRETATSETVGLMLTLALKHWPQNPDIAIHALELYAQYRKNEQTFIPEVFPLVLRIAQEKGRLLDDSLLKKLYDEYLICSSVIGDLRDNQIVEQARLTLQSMP